MSESEAKLKTAPCRYWLRSCIILYAKTRSVEKALELAKHSNVCKFADEPERCRYYHGWGDSKGKTHTQRCEHGKDCEFFPFCIFEHDAEEGEAIMTKHKQFSDNEMLGWRWKQEGVLMYGRNPRVTRFRAYYQKTKEAPILRVPRNSSIVSVDTEGSPFLVLAGGKVGGERLLDGGRAAMHEDLDAALEFAIDFIHRCEEKRSPVLMSLNGETSAQVREARAYPGERVRPLLIDIRAPNPRAALKLLMENPYIPKITDRCRPMDNLDIFPLSVFEVGSIPVVEPVAAPMRMEEATKLMQSLDQIEGLYMA